METIVEDKKGCLVEGLVSYFAPHIVGYKHVKKGLLISNCRNAGIPNNEKRDPSA